MIQGSKQESPEEMSQSSNQSISSNSDIIHPSLIKQLGSNKVKVLFSGIAYKKKRNENWEEIGKSIFSIRKIHQDQRKYQIYVMKTTGKKVSSIQILQYNFIEIDQIQGQILWVDYLSKDRSYKFAFENIGTIVLIKIALQECINKYKKSLNSNKIPTIEQSIEQLQKLLDLPAIEKYKLSRLQNTQKLFKLQKLWVIEKGHYFNNSQKQKNKSRSKIQNQIEIQPKRDQEKDSSQSVQEIVNPPENNQQSEQVTPPPSQQYSEQPFQQVVIQVPQSEQNKNDIPNNDENKQQLSPPGSIVNGEAYDQILRDRGILPLLSPIPSVQSQEQIDFKQNQSSNTTRISLRVQGISQQQSIVAYSQKLTQSKSVKSSTSIIQYMNVNNTTFYQSSIFQYVFFYSKKQLKIQQLYLKKKKKNNNKQATIQNTIKNHPLEIEKDNIIVPKKLIGFENDQKCLILTFDGKLYVKDLLKRSEQYCSTKPLWMLYCMIKKAFITDICIYQQKDKSKQDLFLISTQKSVYKYNIHKQQINKIIKNVFVDKRYKIQSIASFPCGDYAIAYQCGQVRILQCQTKKQIKTFKLQDSIYSLETSKNGLFLLATLGDKVVLINTNNKLFNKLYNEPNTMPIKMIEQVVLEIQSPNGPIWKKQQYSNYKVVQARFDVNQKGDQQYIVWAYKDQYYVWTLHSIINNQSPFFIRTPYDGTITHIEFRNNNSEQIIISTFNSIKVVKNPLKE